MSQVMTVMTVMTRRDTGHSTPPCSENFLELTHSLLNQEVRVSSLCKSKPSILHLSLPALTHSLPTPWGREAENVRLAVEEAEVKASWRSDPGTTSFSHCLLNTGVCSEKCVAQ